MSPQLSAEGSFPPTLVQEVVSTGAILGQGFPVHPALYWPSFTCSLLGVRYGFSWLSQPSGCGGGSVCHWQNKSELLLASQHCLGQTLYLGALLMVW